MPSVLNKRKYPSNLYFSVCFFSIYSFIVGIALLPIDDDLLSHVSNAEDSLSTYNLTSAQRAIAQNFYNGFQSELTEDREYGAILTGVATPLTAVFVVYFLAIIGVKFYNCCCNSDSGTGNAMARLPEWVTNYFSYVPNAIKTHFDPNTPEQASLLRDAPSLDAGEPLEVKEPNWSKRLLIVAPVFLYLAALCSLSFLAGIKSVPFGQSSIKNDVAKLPPCAMANFTSSVCLALADGPTPPPFNKAICRPFGDAYCGHDTAFLEIVLIMDAVLTGLCGLAAAVGVFYFAYKAYQSYSQKRELAARDDGNLEMRRVPKS